MVLLVDFLYVIVHQTGNPHFAAAFVAEVSLVFHSGTLPSGFTSFFIIVSLPLFFVNNKAADSLPLAETISVFHEFSNPPDAKNRHPLFSECRFCYPIIALIFGADLA